MTNKAKALSLQHDYDIMVTARHMAITEAMKQHAIDKLGKIDRFHARISEVVVTMDVQRELNKVDIVLKVNNVRVKSHAAANDMYVAIDMAVDKLQSQLRKYKTRLAEHQARGVSEVDMIVNVLRPSADDVKDVNEEIDEENARRLTATYQPHKIVKQEIHALKTLTYQEAIMKMELSGDQFLLFRHEEDMKLKLIYRRNDGNFGIMEPE